MLTDGQLNHLQERVWLLFIAYGLAKRAADLKSDNTTDRLVTIQV